jgi:hypothetical protein
MEASPKEQQYPAWRTSLARRLRARDACECVPWRAAARYQQAAVVEARDLRASQHRADAEVARLTRLTRILQHKLVSQRPADAVPPAADAGEGKGAAATAPASGDETGLGTDAPSAGADLGLGTGEGGLDGEVEAAMEEILGEDAETVRLRQELTNAMKRNSDAALRILQMTNGIQALEDEIAQRDEIIADRDAALQHAYGTQKALEADVSEKELTTQVLQEELLALQSELASMETESRRLKTENDTLVKRMLEKAAAEASKLNEVNALYDEISAQKKQAARERKAEKEARAIEQQPVKRSLLDRLTGAGAAGEHADSRMGNAATCPTKGVRLIEAHKGECQHVAFSASTGFTLATTGSDQEVCLRCLFVVAG